MSNIYTVETASLPSGSSSQCLGAGKKDLPQLRQLSLHLFKQLPLMGMQEIIAPVFI